MKQFAFFCVMLVIASVDAQIMRHTSSCTALQKQMIMCSVDCKTVQMCLESERGLDTINLETCLGTTTCDASQATCNDKNTCSRAIAITCTGSGRFPDPFDCQRYHDCGTYNTPSTVKECGEDLAFNYKENSCSFDIDDYVCKNRQFNCSRNGQMGSWAGEENSNVYYICASTGNPHDPFKPLIYRCPVKHYFNGTKCVTK